MSFFDNTRENDDQAEPVASTDAASHSSHSVTPEPEPAPAAAVEPVPTAGDANEDGALIAEPTLAAPSLPEPVAARPADPNEPRVRVYDEYGREVQITISEWRERVLPGALEASKDNPDQMGAVLSDALELGLAADVVETAKTLAETDPIPERGAVLYGAALRESGDPAGAEAFLLDATERIPGSALLLLNLAQAQHRLDRLEDADRTIWRSIEADPNLPQSLGWYAQRAREQADAQGANPEELDAAWLQAVDCVSTLPGAWLPFVWLAKASLNRNDLPTAMNLYEQALGRADRPVPHALLQSISGDLGQHGHLAEAAALSAPLYVPEFHGLAVGNNIIKLLADIGDLDGAKARVDELYAQKHPEWQSTLQYWDADLERRRLGAQTAMQPQEAQIGLMAIEGPVWLPQGSPAKMLYPDVSKARARVLFLGSSVSFPESATPEGYQQQMPDAAGRLSRALPLFLSEGASLLLGLDTSDFLPWSPVGGFAVLGQSWGDGDAGALAVEGRASIAVVCHIKLLTMQPTAEHAPNAAEFLPEAMITLRVLRVLPVSSAAAGGPQGPRATTEVLAAADVPLLWAELPKAVVSAWSQLAHALVRATGDNPTPLAPNRYGLPRGADLGGYLLRLEQCLAVRCAATPPPGQPAGPSPFLFGEREIVRGQIDLALRYPNSLPCRLLLNETLLRLKDLQPAIVAEQREAIERLTERHPLPDFEANGVVKDKVKVIFS